MTPGFFPVKSIVIELIQTDVDSHSGNCLHEVTTVRFGISMSAEGSRGCRMVSLRSAWDSTDSVLEIKTKIMELKEKEATYSVAIPRIEQGKHGPGSHKISSPSPVADSTTSRYHKEECRLFTPYAVCLSIWQEDKFCPVVATGRWHAHHYYNPDVSWWYVKIGKDNYFLRGNSLYTHALAYQGVSAA